MPTSSYRPTPVASNNTGMDRAERRPYLVELTESVLASNSIAQDLLTRMANLNNILIGSVPSVNAMTETEEPGNEPSFQYLARKSRETRDALNTLNAEIDRLRREVAPHSS